MSITPVHIAGEQRTTAAVVEITNPYRGRVMAEVPLCGPGEVEVACHAARRALERDNFPQPARARVLEITAGLPRETAESIVTGGTVSDGILAPTVVDGVPRDAKLSTKEVFGPVVVTISYEDFDEAMAIANDTDFGLHAGVFTNEVSTAPRAVRGLDFGGVIINGVPTFRADQQPYGGLRDSGNTREGPAYVVEEMTELRFVSMNA